MSIRSGTPARVVIRELPLLAALLGASGPATAGQEPPTPPGTQAERSADSEAAGGEASIRAERRHKAAALVALLSSPRFAVREEATKALGELGADAIEPLAIAADGDNLEVTCRALRALEEILGAEDDGTFDAAEAALEKLSRSPNRSAAHRAAAILGPLDLGWPTQIDSRRAHRWKRAIARIQNLGGHVTARQQRDGDFRNINPEFEKVPPAFVMLDEGWKGKDAGLINIRRMAEAIPQYVEHQRLQLYIIDGTEVTEDALDQLKKAMPQLDVQFRGRARLGVECSKIETVCRVSGIEKGSAAEKAGILPGDLIRKYDGQELTDFDHLARITRSHKVGDQVELEVVRDGETLKVTAELSGWIPTRAAEEKK